MRCRGETAWHVSHTHQSFVLSLCACETSRTETPGRECPPGRPPAVAAGVGAGATASPAPPRPPVPAVQKWPGARPWLGRRAEGGPACHRFRKIFKIRGWVT